MAMSGTRKAILIIGGIFLAVVLVAIIGIAVVVASLGRGPSIENNSVLVLKISGEMPDYAPEDPMARAFGMEAPTSFSSILTNLRKAKVDKRIGGVLLDVDMPQMSGFDVLRQTRKLKNPPEIIFLTVHRETDLLDEALSLGAKGYVLKDGAVTDIVASVRAVVRGDFYTSPAMTSHLVKRNRRPSAASGLAALTATERQVLRLLADYKTSKEIAAELSVSPRTVETHRANIAAKLNLHGSHALMRFALAHKSEL